MLMAEGISCEPWQGLNRRAFHENAILLDCKQRSQGRLLKPSDLVVPVHHQQTPYLSVESNILRDFLNDVALVASGAGGKDKVVAVCLEDHGDVATLRLAANESLDSGTLQDMEDILELGIGSRLQGKSYDFLPRTHSN